MFKLEEVENKVIYKQSVKNHTPQLHILFGMLTCSTKVLVCIFLKGANEQKA